MAATLAVDLVLAAQADILCSPLLTHAVGNSLHVGVGIPLTFTFFMATFTSYSLWCNGRVLG